MDRNTLPDDLLKKFYRNECSSGEFKWIVNWLKNASQQDRQHFLDQHSQFIRQEGNQHNIFTELNFDEIRKRIQAIEKRKKIFRLVFVRSARLAAAVVLVFGIYHLSAYLAGRKQDPDLKVAGIRNRECHTGYGERAEITLGDGSTVKLNAGSTLTYPGRFEGGQRIISLKGQALFKVASDSLKPFIINTSSFKVQVLGTAFDVKSFDGDHFSSVCVLHGTVKVTLLRDEKQSYILTKNEQLTIDARDGHIRKRLVNARTSVAWINGILRFEQVPMDDALKQLERWYNVKIDIPENLGLDRVQVTGQHKDNGLYEVLDALHFTHGLQYKAGKGEIRITGLEN